MHMARIRLKAALKTSSVQKWLKCNGAGQHEWLTHFFFSQAVARFGPIRYRGLVLPAFKSMSKSPLSPGMQDHSHDSPTSFNLVQPQQHLNGVSCKIQLFALCGRSQDDLLLCSPPSIRIREGRGLEVDLKGYLRPKVRPYNTLLCALISHTNTILRSKPLFRVR